MSQNKLQELQRVTKFCNSFFGFITGVEGGGYKSYRILKVNTYMKDNNKYIKNSFTYKDSFLKVVTL